jgi:uncharacterized protein YqeY
MDLEQKILDDLKSAMLGRLELETSVLRMLKSEIKYAEIAQGNKLNDDQIIQVVRKELKKRKDSAQAFLAAKQNQRAEAESKEAKILEKYLPTQVAPELIEEYIKQQLNQYGSLTGKEKGLLIKDTLAHFSNQTDGQTVASIIDHLI